jgi:hypothetical protein
VLDVVTFLGDLPSADDHARAQRHAILATLVATACPAGACYLAVRWPRPVAARVFGAGAVLGLVGGLLLYAVVSPHAAGAPAAPDDGPPVCQEHSGGDSTCPGG